MTFSDLLRFKPHALGRPYHAARVRIGPRAGSTPHGHADFHELMGVVAGRGEHLLERGPVPLAEGDVVLVRPGDRHAFTGRGPDGLEFVNVAFSSSAWRGFCDLSGIGPGWEDAPGPVSLLAPGPEHRALAGAAFRTALDQFQAGPDMLDLLRFWTDLLALAARRTCGSACRGWWNWPGSARRTLPGRCGGTTA